MGDPDRLPRRVGGRGGRRQEDDFRISSVRHDLMLRPDRGTVIRHARDAQDGISTRILRSGPPVLDSPSLTVEVAALFEDDPPA